MSENNGDAVLLVDWLNLSIHLKNLRLTFDADLVEKIIELANRHCMAAGGLRLTRAHFVAERYPSAVESAVRGNLIAQLHKTRTAKEQADLKIAVLAMDHVHDKRGCPKMFILATGDQDFVPLIERFIDQKAHVALFVASQTNLSAEYRSIAAQPGVSLTALTDALNLQPIPSTDASGASLVVLGLLKLCLTGGILGGDQTRNAQRLAEWGVFAGGRTLDTNMEGARQQFSRTDTRTIAAPAKSQHGNHVRRGAKRTFLDFNLPVVAEHVFDSDWILRRLGTSTRPLKRGDLGVGRFADDNGNRLNTAISSLATLGWISEYPDETLGAQMEWAADGVLEPIWRVILEVNRRAHEEQANGVSRDDLFKDLRSTPIAHDRARRGGRAAGSAIDCARRLGVIDAVPHREDEFRLAVIESHPLCQQATVFVRAASRIAGDYGSNWSIREFDMLRLMREHDEGSNVPVFGYDNRDRQRVIRLMTRTRLMTREGPRDQAFVTVSRSAWLTKIANR